MLHLHKLIFTAFVSFVAAAPLPPQPSSYNAVTSSYAPTAGWTYAVEAIRQSLWPACPYRFLSFPDSCDKVDLWRGAGSNQMWTLESASSADTSLFYLRASCGSYLRFIVFELFSLQVSRSELPAAILLIAASTRCVYRNSLKK